MVYRNRADTGCELDKTETRGAYENDSWLSAPGTDSRVAQTTLDHWKKI